MGLDPELAALRAGLQKDGIPGTPRGVGTLDTPKGRKGTGVLESFGSFTAPPSPKFEDPPPRRSTTNPNLSGKKLTARASVSTEGSSGEVTTEGEVNNGPRSRWKAGRKNSIRGGQTTPNLDDFETCSMVSSSFGGNSRNGRSLWQVLKKRSGDKAFSSFSNVMDAGTQDAEEEASSEKRMLRILRMKMGLTEKDLKVESIMGKERHQVAQMREFRRQPSLLDGIAADWDNWQQRRRTAGGLEKTSLSSPTAAAAGTPRAPSFPTTPKAPRTPASNASRLQTPKSSRASSAASTRGRIVLSDNGLRSLGMSRIQTGT